MHINTINLFSGNHYTPIRRNNINFTGLWDDEYQGEFGDDPSGAKDRERMRWNLYSRFMPIVDPTEDASSEMRYALSLEDIHIKNFRRLPNSSYSGESLIHHPEFFKLLPHSGVHRVIDLKSNPEVKKACEEQHVEYVSYDTSWGYGGKSVFKDREDLRKERSEQLIKEGATKEDYDLSMKYLERKLDAEKETYIKELAAFIQVVNLGHFYMSCDLGDYRTVNALALVSTFNPKWGGAKIKPHGVYVPKMKNLYNNLTPEDKKVLGIDEKYDEYLRGYIERLYNVYIMNLEELANSSYTGESLQSHPEHAKLLKTLEVKNVIGLGDNPKFKVACEAEGIAYHPFETKLADTSNVFKDFSALARIKDSELKLEGVSKAVHDFELRLYKNNLQREMDIYVNHLAKIIKMVNEGHYCIASEYGSRSTKDALALVSAFNPKWEGSKIRPNPQFTDQIINFYNNLTEENKKTLGIDKEEESFLSKYIKNLA